MFRQWSPALPVSGGLILGWLLVGCGREGVRVYEAPKDPAPSIAQPTTPSSPPSPPAQIAWNVPASWTDRGASGMRAGSFAVTNAAGESADISVIAMSTWAGQELQNVNRWRAQVGLQPLSAAELAQHTATVKIAGTDAPLFELAGTPLDGDKPTRILAAVLPLPQVAWYFKMTGDDALVAAQKAAFIHYLESVHFGAPVAAATATPAPPPVDGHSHSDHPQWTVPADWKETPPGRMQAARFVAGEAGDQVEITFTVLAGTGGGVLPNVNRWRSQLKLAPIDDATLAKTAEALDAKAGTATVVDMTADDKSNRIVAAVVVRDADTWFFRLSGPDGPVGTHKPAFVHFVQSAQ